MERVRAVRERERARESERECRSVSWTTPLQSSNPSLSEGGRNRWRAVKVVAKRVSWCKHFPCMDFFLVPSFSRNICMRTRSFHLVLSMICSFYDNSHFFSHQRTYFSCLGSSLGFLETYRCEMRYRSATIFPVYDIGVSRAMPLHAQL